MRTLPKLGGTVLFLTVLLLPLNININADSPEAILKALQTGQESAVLNSSQNSLNFGVVIDNGLTLQIETKGKTVKEVLANAGIATQESDIIFPSPEKEYQPGTKIIIERATPLTLNLYGNPQEIFSQKKTVGEVLEEQKIELKESDLMNVKLEDNIFPKMEIKIWEKPKPVPPKPVSKPLTTGEAQIGRASWYSFIPGDFCASTAFKRGTKLLVTNLENDYQVVVTVNDYGPFTSKIIDLEKTAFAKLAPLSKGVIKVKVEKIN